MSINAPATPPSQRAIFQVHELVATLKHGLEMSFPGLWVEGEISNFVSARSGHWYFTLKDGQAQLRCAMFRYQRGQRTPPQDGQRCLVHGRPTIFTARGELQLVVDSLEDAGAGALHLAFERLKQKLSDEGLFAADRKRPLPTGPRVIGVLSSPVGAAIHDVLTTLRRRQPLLRVVLYPVLVQGATAAAQMIRGLQLAARRNECDVLLLTRGGGSLEDLMAFNDEGLARAIAACPLPLVSAVGHEVDFSISDFVADVRAATPTAAAELLSRDQAELLPWLARQRAQLASVSQRQLRHSTSHWLETQRRLRLRSPQRQLEQLAQSLDNLQLRLNRETRNQLGDARQALCQSQQRLQRSPVLSRLRQADRDRGRQIQQLTRTTQQRLATAGVQLRHCQQRLAAAAPQRVLERGYAIAWRGDEALRDPADAGNATLRLQLAKGRLVVRACETE